jgi:hypothetical protein
MQKDQEALCRGADTLLEVAMGSHRACSSTRAPIGRQNRDAGELENSSESNDHHS